MSLLSNETSVRLEAFRWNEAGLIALMRGGVMPNLILRAIQVEAAAKRNASGRPGPNVITGRLRGSLTWRLGDDFRGLYADIGTSVFYAPFVENKYPYLMPALDAARI